MQHFALYSIRTWDMDLQQFTPQEGVPAFNLTLYQLRQSMRMLQACGYSCDRNKAGFSDPSVLVERMNVTAERGKGE